MLTSYPLLIKFLTLQVKRTILNEGYLGTESSQDNLSHAVEFMNTGTVKLTS